MVQYSDAAAISRAGVSAPGETQPMPSEEAVHPIRNGAEDGESRPGE